MRNIKEVITFMPFLTNIIFKFFKVVRENSKTGDGGNIVYHLYKVQLIDLESEMAGKDWP